MQFLYLIQGKRAAIKAFKEKNPQLEVLSLTYDAPLAGSYYFPNSAWTSGRNVLFREAEKLAKAYDYYIFLDDDLKFILGSFALLEQQVKKHAPEVVFSNYNYSSLFYHLPKQVSFIKLVLNWLICKGLFFTFMWFRRAKLVASHPKIDLDNCFFAVKTEAARKYYLLPYFEDYCHVCETISIEILYSQLCLLNVRASYLNKLVVQNTNHHGSATKYFRRPFAFSTYFTFIKKLLGLSAAAKAPLQKTKSRYFNYFEKRLKPPPNISPASFLSKMKNHFKYHRDHFFVFFYCLRQEFNWRKDLVDEKTAFLSLAGQGKITPLLREKHRQLLKKNYRYRFIAEENSAP